MTEYKEYDRASRHRSLYLGLLYNIMVGVLLSALVFFAIALPARMIIDRYYLSQESQEERLGEYLFSLENYVNEHRITHDTIDKIGGWIRENPYVYLLVYQKTKSISPAYYSYNDKFAPGDDYGVTEHPGSRIDEKLSREELIDAAKQNGFHRIDILGGYIIVAIKEYSENFYYSIFNIISIFAAVIAFVLRLVRYIRVLIERIKRFESDVTIVSEIDMDYEIVSEGIDEISTLSTKVDAMRRTMLDHIKNEQEAREANTELITAISHDIRTPLTVLMGYIEMMKEHSEDDSVMQSYIAATESTALRLKHLSDDMFKYSLAFGDTKKSVKLEIYDFITLTEQLFSEHFLLMREQGYDIRVMYTGEPIIDGTTVYTDAPNLMRIVDNVFSNLSKYADPTQPIVFTMHSTGDTMTMECRNKILQDTEGAESNGIGLKSCVRLGSLVGKKFEYKKDGEFFVCRLVLDIKAPE